MNYSVISVKEFMALKIAFSYWEKAYIKSNPLKSKDIKKILKRKHYE